LQTGHPVTKDHSLPTRYMDMGCRVRGVALVGVDWYPVEREKPILLREACPSMDTPIPLLHRLALRPLYGSVSQPWKLCGTKLVPSGLRPSGSTHLYTIFFNFTFCRTLSRAIGCPSGHALGRLHSRTCLSTHTHTLSLSLCLSVSLFHLLIAPQ